MVLLMGQWWSCSATGWIGYSDTQQEGTWEWYDGSTSRFHLSDCISPEANKTSFSKIIIVGSFRKVWSERCLFNITGSFNNFGTGEGTAGTSENCGAMLAAGTWADSACTSPQQYVCKKQKGTTCQYLLEFHYVQTKSFTWKETKWTLSFYLCAWQVCRFNVFLVFTHSCYFVVSSHFLSLRSMCSLLSLSRWLWRKCGKML